jgi:adenosine deaminase
MTALSLDALRSLPKALLHDHLDGGLRPSTVIELAAETGHRLPHTDPAELASWFTRGAETNDILQYLATFEHTAGVMQTATALHRVARECVHDLADDGVVYAEVRFAPELHTTAGLALDEVVEAVQDGFATGMRERPGAVVNTIVCAMRTEQRSVEIAELAARWRRRDARIVAFDLAGAETGWPPSLHAAALAVARAELLHVTVHASEPPDLLLISDALQHGAERIGHGVRLAADCDLADLDHPRLGPLARYVRERQICLEMAPTCNVQIGAVPSVAHHPVGPFLRLGFNVSVNTDNRLMSNVSVTSEMAAVQAAHEMTVDELRRLVVNAVRSGFGDHDERLGLIRDVIDPGWAAVGAAGQ